MIDPASFDHDAQTLARALALIVTVSRSDTPEGVAFASELAAALDDDIAGVAAVELRITQERTRLESSPIFYSTAHRPPHEALVSIVGRLVAALHAGTPDASVTTAALEDALAELSSDYGRRWAHPALAQLEAEALLRHALTTVIADP